MCTSCKGCGNGLGSSSVRQLPLLSSPLAALARECPCEGAGDRKRKGEELKKGREAAGSQGQPYPADYQPIRRCPVLSWRQQRGKTGGGEDRGGDKYGKKEGGWTARRIPRVNYPREGGTVTNTLHLICKAAAKVHLSTASERPAIAPRQLMSPFNDMCFSV